MAEFSLITCEDQSQWDRFVGASPQGSIFNTSAFLRTLKEEFQLLFVCENGVPLLGCPILLREGQPLPAPYLFTLFQGPMFSAEVEQQPRHRRIPARLKIVEFFLEQLAQRWPFLSFCFHPAFEDLRAVQWFHYHEPEKGQFAIRLAYTGRLNLKEFPALEDYLQSVRTVRRQEYRKAESLGFTLEETRDVAVLDRLNELTFARQGLDRTEEEVSLLQRIFDDAMAHGYGYCLVARDAQGAPASAVLFLHDAKTAYYLFGASDPEFRKTGAGSWLLIKAIERARELGCETVDFVGINSPNRGDFKTSFNAAPVPYLTATWTRPAEAPAPSSL